MLRGLGGLCSNLDLAVSKAADKVCHAYAMNATAAEQGQQHCRDLCK